MVAHSTGMLQLCAEPKLLQQLSRMMQHRVQLVVLHPSETCPFVACLARWGCIGEDSSGLVRHVPPQLMHRQLQLNGATQVAAGGACKGQQGDGRSRPGWWVRMVDAVQLASYKRGQAAGRIQTYGCARHTHSQNRAHSRAVSTRCQTVVQWQSAPDHARRLQQRGKMGGLHLASFHGQAHSMHITRSMRRRSTKSAPAGRGAGTACVAVAAASAVAAAAWQCLKQLAHTSSQAAQARQLGAEGGGMSEREASRVAEQTRHPPCFQ